MSSKAAVAGFKKCSRVHNDKSVYDFVHHADSIGCSPGLQVLKLEMCKQRRGTRGRSREGCGELRVIALSPVKILRCCWWGSHTTAVYSSTGRTRLL